MSDLSIRGTNKIVFGPFIVMTCIVILPLLVLGQTGPDLSEIPLARPRITQEIDDSKPVQLKGHVHPKAKAQYDQGEVAPSFGMDYVTLLLKPSVEQRVAMDKLLAELQDRSSPNYHNWLTVEEYADRFGLSDSDVSRTVAWLEAKGLTIKYVAHGRDWVAFGGTADQVEKTFHTKIHRYRVDGEEHYANATAPSIPAALAGVVSYIQGLDDFRPKPLYTEGSGKHELAPDDVATIYHVNALYGAGMDGTGQAIVVVGQSDINLADILEFRNTFGLPIFIPQRLQQPTGLDPGLTGDKNEEEGDLDVEWAGALARNASIYYIYSKGAFDSANYVIDNNASLGNPSVISFSFGACEQQVSQAFATSEELEARKANLEGMTWVAGSGDSGAAGCDYDSFEALSGLAVQVPASLPGVTGVGGTEFDEGSATYWNSTNAPDDGSAIKYIPETGWNDYSFTGLAASGGGLSTVFHKPSWQSTLPALNGFDWRGVPDLALAASANHDPYIFCSETAIPTIGSCFATVGGTSAAAPVFAGIVALLNQYLGHNNTQSPPGLGDINPRLYQLAQATGDDFIFHDITTGNNIVPCLQGTSACPSGVPFQFGYSAGQGYDLVTGLGSVDAYNLVTNWNGTLSVSLSASPPLGSAPLTTTLTASVTSTATGTLNYTFWWNCTDPGTSVANVTSVCGDPTDPTIGSKFDGITDNPKIVSHVYSAPGSYAAKIVAEQGSANPAENRIPVTVTTSALTVSSVTFSSYSVAAGTSVNGTVTLNSPAPSNGVSVVLTTQPSGIVRLPQNIPIPAGSVTGGFTASTSCVPAQTGVVVTASYNATQAATTLLVNPQPSTAGLAGLGFNPSTVNSGSSTVGTITLTSPAASCGAYVTLTAASQDVVQLPPPVTIPSGGTTATFTASALTVSSLTNVSISATYNNSSANAVLSVIPTGSAVVISNVSFGPASVVGGGAASGTVSLTGPAPAGGAKITFGSNSPNLLQFPNLTVPAGSTSAPFSVQTSAVSLNTPITVTASYINSSANTTLTLTPPSGPVLSAVTISPSTIVGGASAVGIVTLTGPAPAGGAVVTIISNNTHFVQVPTSQMVTVQPGYTNADFPITTSFTGSTVGATITGSYNGTICGATVTILPVAVTAVTFSPTTVQAGTTVSVTVWLSGPAPAGGAAVSLVSLVPSALQIASPFTVPAGALSASMTATTSPVASQESVGVTASYNSSSVTENVIVVPAPPLGVNSLNFSPSTVTGGTSASGQVTLTALAPTGGVNVALNSASGLVQVPSTVFVPAGGWYAPVTAQTSAVRAITNVTVTASYGGSSQNATVTLVPPLPFLASLSLNPILVSSGSSVTGTVTLTAPPPLEGIEGVVNLTSNAANTVAHVPQTVVVQPGNTSANFTITTSPIGFIAPITITASYSGVSQSVLLTVAPPGTPLAPSVLTLNPATVTGGANSNGSVTLTGTAPAGDAVIVVSSDSAAVQVPLVVTVPPGYTSAAFMVTTSTVSVISTAAITATLNGVSQSTLLTLKPSGSPPTSTPVPFLTSPLMPLSQTPGGAAFSLTIGGVGFVPGAQVLWNGTALPTTFVSGSQVQATVSPTSIQTNESTYVTVTNPGQEVLSSNPLPEHLTYPTSSPAFGPSSLPISGSAMTVATGDFNGDGKLDLVVGKSDGSGLSIFLGNGDGTFGPERIVSFVPTPMTPYQVAAADLNGDGKLDIIFNQGGAIGILLGNGDGTFTAMPYITLPSAPGTNAAFALGDLNGDGSLDLVVTGTYLTQAYVLLGNGDGTFGAAASVGSVNQPFSVALADFNGDGKLDIALPDFNNKAVAVLFGNGDGTFRSQQEYSTNGYAGSLAVADFDGDGHPDIAVANQGPFGSTGSGIVILRNNGNGTFTLLPPNGVGQNFYYLAVDDFNGDGKLDLLSVIFQPSVQALLFLGNGDGAFASTPISIPVTNPASITVADINADGAPDILVPNWASSGGVSILLQSISPIIRVAPSNLSFVATQGGANTSPIALAISNTGGGTLAWSASSSQPWAVLNQSSGTAPSALTVIANPSGLDPGTYNGTITVTATGASNSPQLISVTLIVNPVPVVVRSLSFSPATVVGPDTATGTVTLSSAASAGGVTVSLSNTNSAVQVPSTVSIPANSLSGPFSATVSAVPTQTFVAITASYNGASTNATLEVDPAVPTATLGASILTFSNQVVGTTSPAQSVTVSNTGTGPLNFSGIATTGDFAVQAVGTTCSISSPLAASTACTVAITFTPAATGARAGSLTVTDNNNAVAGSTQTVTLSGTGTAPLVITAGSAVMTYGGTVPTITPSYSGFVNGDTPASLTTPPTCSTTATQQSQVGSYPSSCSGAVDSNYAITYLPGTVTVSAALLTITANNATRAYGAANSNFTATYIGFVNGDTASSLTGTLTCTTTATTSSPAGTYPIACSGQSSTNYNLTYSPGTLTVTAVPLTITANNATRPYGAPNPTFTATYSGFVNGDTASSLTGTLTCTTAAITSSPAATYPITCSGQSSANYNITYSPGTLTVTPGGPVVSLSPASLTFPAEIVGASSAQTITLTNTGNASLTISSIAAIGDFSQTNTCGSIVSAGANCAIAVTFKPRALGTSTGTLSISDNAAGSPHTVALSGTGLVFTSGPHPPLLPPRPPQPVPGQPIRVLPPAPIVTAPITVPVPTPGPAPVIRLATSSLTFSAQSVGIGSRAQTVTLTNTSSVAVTISSITASGDFSQTNTCPTTLSPGADCTISVTFKPAAAGTRTGTLSISDSATGSPRTVALSGRGLVSTGGPGAPVHQPSPPPAGTEPTSSAPKQD